MSYQPSFTFIIGYRHKSDRLNNLKRTIDWVNGFSNSQLILVEQDKHSKISHLNLRCEHIFVKSIMPYGAFVEFLPGKDGLLHISEIDWKRLDTMEGVEEQYNELTDLKIKLGQSKGILKTAEAELKGLETKEELLQTQLDKVEEDIERFSFNTSVSSFMICINELTDLKCNKRKIIQDLVIVLSAYAPHISEELWTLLGNAPGTLSVAPYPVFNPEYLVENEFSYPVSVNGKTRMNLNISLSLSQAEVEAIVLANDDLQKYLEGKTPKKIIFVKGKIINIVI
jgi:leucyl-tRNA synthetase